MNRDNQKKVFVAMSGGVDSSVAAFLLKDQEYNVTGAHMVCWDGCENNEDRHDAERVALKLGIPFHVFDFRKEYKERVFDYMIGEYSKGRTPNPDAVCNSEIKFGIFLKKAHEMGADFIATGHYVRKEAKLPLGSLASMLLEARDKSKDQSYFLCRLTQEQIKYSLFPIGDYLKSEVREIAAGAGLITASKKDSQGLCFVGKVDFQDFLRGYIPKKEGKIINSKGELLGKHDGSHFFTPGQRHGIKLGGFKEPLYVAETHHGDNTVLVAEGKEDQILYKKEIYASEINWISGEAPEFPFECEARIRYRQPLQEAKILIQDSLFLIRFKKPQRGVAPGQFAAFYKEGELLGGGIIES
ncbi:tRNA 2-thiouridine(34) synthase MnmA [Candidatus Giovannonibacteria bacterium]|nr:tRNA 2-thiouridine(34) synthase MnmA [Candidatus Giovannonibacteria bacterium]